MTNPDRPSIPTSPSDMLVRTRRRAEQLRRRRRAGLSALAAVVVALAIAGPLLTRSSHRSRVVGVTGVPTSVSSPPTTPVATTSSVPAPSTTAPAATVPATTVPATGGGGGGGTTTLPARAVPECATSQLRIALTSPSGAAGSVGYELQFVNIGTVSCSLGGYPGVSYRTGATRALVGAPASRDALSPVVTITVAPGHAAQAPLIEVDSRNYPPNTCQLHTNVSGLLVYPPDQTASLFVAQSTQACSNPADPVLMVGPIRAS